MREPNILHKYLRRYILFRLKKCVFIFFLKSNFVLDHIISFIRLQIEQSGGQVDANVWIFIRGQFKIRYLWLKSAGIILFVIEKLTIDRQISESQEWRSPVPDDTTTHHVLFLTGSPLPRIPDHTESYDQNKNNETWLRFPIQFRSDGVVKPPIHHLPR